jgi:hypothetical protein
MEHILTKDDIKFLKELAIEIKTQNTHGTAKPVIYRIMEDIRTYGIDLDYADNVALVIGDDFDCFTEDQLEAAKEFYINHWVDGNDINKLEELNNASCLEDLAEVIEKDGKTDCEFIGYKDEVEFHNSFITKKACEIHIAQNYYHYTNPKVYTSHAFRNPELERLLEIVEKFANIEIE